MLDVGALFEEHRNLVFAFLYRRTGNVQLAEDLAQETWIKVHRYADSYEDRGVRVQAWLLTIATNVHTDYHRRQQSSKGTHLNIPIEHAGNALVTSAEEEALGETFDLQAQMEQLTERQRAVIDRRYLRGLKHQEIADETGYSYYGVKKLQSRGLDNLRKMLSEEEAA